MINIYPVPGLSDGGAIKAQIFNFVQRLHLTITIQLCSFSNYCKAPLLAVVMIDYMDLICLLNLSSQ